MGLLWRLFAPTGLKSARRKVRRVTHPVRALTPRPVRRARWAAYKATHPGKALEWAVSDEIARAVRGRARRRGRRRGRR